MQPGQRKSPKSAMDTEASGEPRTFQSRVVGGAPGVESGGGVSVGGASEGAEVEGGTRVFVGIGEAADVGSTISGPDEQAHETIASADIQTRRSAIRVNFGDRGRMDI